MILTASYARNSKELYDAQALSRFRYLKDFGVDLSAIKESSTSKFEHEIIIISDESNKVVGTATMMYPVDNILYPTEDLFGIDIKGQIPNLADFKLVEVGRVAKSESSTDGELIINALMLATLNYLNVNKLDGWIATVKTPMLRYLKKKNLKNMTMLIDTEGSEAIFSSLVIGYKKTNDIFYFMSTYAETLKAFSLMNFLLDEGKIKLELGKNS